MDEPKDEMNRGNSLNSNSYANQSRNLNGNSRFNSNQNIRQNSTRINQNGIGNAETEKEDLLNVIPQELRDSLQIKSDVEHNSFIVSGASYRIEKFRKFVKLIDKPVPVITIDVMILEVSNSASVSTGITLGIGDKPATTQGGVFPNANLTLGANSINKIIGGFNGFGSLNLGKVTPNFYATIEALETNGDLEIKSTPKLTALNGHEATLSNGERSYYVETITDIIGSQNPQTREIKNYIPVEANLAIKIRPMVSGDGQITLSIKVIQSSFNGKKIDPEAPPGINSREFTSTIRVKNEEVIILGGLEENLKNNSGSGVPFLARIPIIKYLFSKRTRTKSKMKLSVLIKPTILFNK
jgi:type IV pilus assembly protein PilQ